MTNIDFWVQLGVSYVWSAIFVTGIIAFLVGMGLMRLIDRGQVNALKERKELAEDRLKKVTGRVTKQHKSAQALFNRVAKLEKAVTEGQPSTVKRVVKELVTDSGALADSTRVTSDLLNRYWDKKAG